MNKGKNRIIVNTSPWIALSICGQNYLLKMLQKTDDLSRFKTLTSKLFAYDYMHRSINYFRDIRQKIENTYAIMVASGVKDVLNPPLIHPLCKGGYRG